MIPSQPSQANQSSETKNEVLPETVALLAGSRMPLILASAEVSNSQRQLADGLLALGALLLTNHPTGFFPGNILDLGTPEPGAPLPEQAWKHAEEACKKTDLALVFEPLDHEMTTLADLIAWSGNRVLVVPPEGATSTSQTPESPCLDLPAALAWLHIVGIYKENRP